jgi:hypothetical protein
MNLKPILWNRDTFDWTKVYGSNKSSKKLIAQDAFNEWMLEPVFGTISLQHDIVNSTVQEIPPTLDILKESGYFPVLLSKCANITTIYNDTMIEQAGELTATANKIVQDYGNTTTVSSESGRNATSDANGISVPYLLLVILSSIIF